MPAWESLTPERGGVATLELTGSVMYYGISTVYFSEDCCPGRQKHREDDAVPSHGGEAIL